MEIKQGKVVLNEKEFVCSYGESFDGKRFYFVAGGELPGGIRIATLDVAESLNQTNGVIKTLGLVDSNGNVLVPLANKSVNTIDSKYIVFEKTVPAPEEVVNIEQIKSDPVESAKFAETAIAIKEKMKEVAGENAVDVYANPEGSASVYTLDGKNIVDGRYYNYIVKGKKGFAFATSKTGEVTSVGDETAPVEPSVPEVPVVPVVEETPGVIPVVENPQPIVEEAPAVVVVPEDVPVVTEEQLPVAETEEETSSSALLEIETETKKEEPLPEPEPPREKTEKDLILDQAVEVVKKQKNKIRELSRIIREQGRTIDDKVKLEETLNKTIEDQTKVIEDLESDKRGLEIENAKINAGIINLQDVVKDAIEVLEDNEIEEVYVKAKKAD